MKAAHTFMIQNNRKKTQNLELLRSTIFMFDLLIQSNNSRLFMKALIIVF